MFQTLELIYKFLILIGVIVVIAVLWPLIATLVHALTAIAHLFGS